MMNPPITSYPNRFSFFILASVLGIFFVQSGALQMSSANKTICDLQGSGPISPLEGRPIRTRGVVTLDWDQTSDKGFFMQDDTCDTDPATSDGIFVYLGEKTDLVSVGDHVLVQGWVNEYQGLTEVSVDPEDVTVLGKKPLPQAVIFSPPWDAAGALAWFEAHEGMRVTMPDVIVVGPTTSRDETYVVDSRWGIGRVLQGRASGAVVKIADAGLYEITPEVKVGDRVLQLAGVLDVRNQEFQIQLTAAPVVVPAAAPLSARPNLADDLTFATLNLHNLFDTFDDPATQDSVLTAGQYQTKLEKLARVISGELGEPLFLGLQEAENDAVLQALANRPEFSEQYGFEWVDGPDIRGIDVALFYRMDRVEILSSESRQGCTGLVDGLGPDGNLNPQNPQNALTCDLDGQPGLDGNRLFSRPPLLVHLAVCDGPCTMGAGRTVYAVIVVHLKSKSQDTAAVPYTLPRRMAQARFLGDLVRQVEAGRYGGRVIVLGDFNDYPDSAPIGVLRGAGMINLMDGVPAGSGYTYNFKGISQVLDHVFVSPSLAGNPFRILAAVPVPVSSDYPADLEKDPTTPLRASDHDPVRVGYLSFDRVIYFPFIGGDE